MSANVYNALLCQARDDLGNKRLTGGDEFVAELRGPSTVYATLADGGDGAYTATLNTTVAADHLLHVTTGAPTLCYIYNGNINSSWPNAAPTLRRSTPQLPGDHLLHITTCTPSLCCILAQMQHTADDVRVCAQQ